MIFHKRHKNKRTVGKFHILFSIISMKLFTSAYRLQASRRFYGRMLKNVTCIHVTSHCNNVAVISALFLTLEHLMLLFLVTNKGRSMAQAISRRSLIAEARVRARVSPCKGFVEDRMAVE
jgi:hypothetical protein